MAKKQAPTVSAGEALSALEYHLQERTIWMLKAQAVMQLIGEELVDDLAKVRGKCKEIADSMPE